MWRPLRFRLPNNLVFDWNSVLGLGAFRECMRRRNPLPGLRARPLPQAGEVTNPKTLSPLPLGEVAVSAAGEGRHDRCNALPQRQENPLPAGTASKLTPGAQHVLGLCLLRDGQPDAAIECFSSSLNSPWKGAPSNWPALAIAHSAAGQPDQAEEWLRKTQEWSEHDPLDVRSELEPIARMTFQLLLREAEQHIDQPASH